MRLYFTCFYFILHLSTVALFVSRIQFFAAPCFTTKRCTIRPINIDDHKVFDRFYSNLEMMRFFGLEKAYSFFSSYNIVVFQSNRWKNNTLSGFWVIEDFNQNILGGIGTALPSKPYSLVVNESYTEIWYMLDTQYQGKGYLSESLSRILEYLHVLPFEIRGKGVYAKCSPFNVASLKVLNRFNFQYDKNYGIEAGGEIFIF